MLDFLHSGFLRSAHRVPDRVALMVQGRAFTYADLLQRARRVAATIQRRAPAADVPLVAVLADRSLTAFSGILGALIAGRGYVPLNPTFPVAKTRQMLERSGCGTLIADEAATTQLRDLLAGLKSVAVIQPDSSTEELEPPDSLASVPQTPDDVAYLLFTSGSTGIPKGVMVTHRNATHFVQTAVERYGITGEDRLSQMFDTTFDLSVFDMFVAWHEDASVYCPPRECLWNPASFIQKHRLTVWFSVPSTGILMNRIGALKAGAFPSLRWSLFCGERLPADLVTAWSAAAPGSIVENLYGPTETTVACTAYRWDPESSPAECEAGVVPIGSSLPGTLAVVVDEQFVEVGPGEVGELLIAGPQRTPGYWQDDTATAKAFAHVEGRAEPFYRTGDRVSRAADGGPLRFLGRLDHQIKVRGHRVDLGEVEAALQQLPGVETAAALPLPSTAETVGIAAFVTGQELETIAIRSALSAMLQEWAVPRVVRVLPHLPLNSNGKIDRKALQALLIA